MTDVYDLIHDRRQLTAPNCGAYFPSSAISNTTQESTSPDQKSENSSEWWKLIPIIGQILQLITSLFSDESDSKSLENRATAQNQLPLPSHLSPSEPSSTALEEDRFLDRLKQRILTLVSV